MLENALAIATEAHKEQKRKWGTQAPYITHPIRCAEKAKELGLPEYVQAAMYLHDVIEDIAIPTNTVEYWSNRIVNECGQKVLDLVWELTNPSDTQEWLDSHPNPKRVEKWEANLTHLKVISDVAKCCKMIDRLDNVANSSAGPYKWRQKYKPESMELLSVCRHVNENLAKELEIAIEML